MSPEMTSRWVLFTILLCLAVFEGLLITMLSHWPSVLDTSKTRIQEALYVSSPVASSAYLFQPRQPRKLLLVVAVLSQAARKARRDAIRETWFSDCRQRTDDVFCAFFTDQAGLDNETSSAVMKESEENNDLVFLEVEGKSGVVVSMRSYTEIHTSPLFKPWIYGVTVKAISKKGKKCRKIIKNYQDRSPVNLTKFYSDYVLCR